MNSDTVAIVGKSGSGNSTLMPLLRSNVITRAREYRG